MSKKKKDIPKAEAPDKGPWYGKKVPKADLKRILAKHKEWLDSKEKSGECANLSGAHLRGADLGGTDLRRADLTDANLQGADLSYTKLSSVDFSGTKLEEANLSGVDLSFQTLHHTSLYRTNLSLAFLIFSDLSSANILRVDFSYADIGFANLPLEMPYAIFDGANLDGTHFDPEADENEGSTPDKFAPQRMNLTGARFRNAKLRGQNFSEAVGLEATAFAGASIPNVTLPQRIADFPDLIHIQGIAKHARTVFLFTVAACVFVLITLLTGDAAGSKITIPFFGVDVSRTAFNWVAPSVLLILYLYFLSYLERMWRALAGLPAIFPDGRSLEERAYPWMMTSLLFAYMPLIKKRGPGLWLIPLGLSLALGWAFVPLTLLSFSSLQGAGTNAWQEIFFIAAFALSAFIGLSFLADARWQLKNQPEDAQPFDDCLPYDWRKK